jgi:hypothetical protein
MWMVGQGNSQKHAVRGDGVSTPVWGLMTGNETEEGERGRPGKQRVPLDSQEKRMAMEVILEKIRIGEKDVNNGRIRVRKLLTSMKGDDSDPRLEALNETNFEDPGVTCTGSRHEWSHTFDACMTIDY